jgi:hypothetical protein
LTDKPGQGPRWQKLDAYTACERVWRRLESLATNATGIVLILPDYLRSVQVDALRKLGEKLRLPIVGSLPLSLAGALAAQLDLTYGDHDFRVKTWVRSVLVMDVDEHALTIAWIKAVGDKAQLVESRSFPHLGWRVWKERLIDGVSDLFVIEHRRDPRDAPQAEQSLFDQLELLANGVLENRPLQLAVRGREWLKHLLVQPAQTVQICQPLVHKIAAEAEQLLHAWPATEGPPALVMTRGTGRLPGLLDALQTLPIANSSAETRLPQIKATRFDEADYGDGMIDEPTVHVSVLRAEAPAQAAHALIEGFADRTLAGGHLDLIIPLPESGPPPAASSQRTQQPAVGSQQPAAPVRKLAVK